MKRTVRLVLIVAVVATAVIILSLPSCGPSSYDNVQAPADPAFEKIRPIVDRVCLKCHNTQKPSLDSAVLFKTATVKAEIESGGMPLGGPLTAPDKKALLDYLNG